MESVDAMSKYETISTAISIVAIVLTILIPLSQWAWKKWIMIAKVSYYPTGQATLFFNQSGSYIRLNGVLESERSAATIKKMSLTLTRKHDDRKLNLVWSCFISPVNQNMLGNYLQTTEAAHPFRVEADSVACAFIEYSDPSDSSGIKIRKICSDLVPHIQKIIQDQPYDKALSLFSKSSEYIDAKNSLLGDFFWEVGKYSAVVTVEYDKQKTKSFSYEFNVTEQNSMDLRANIDESLIIKLKDHYRVPWAFKSPLVEISEVKS